MCDAIQAMQRQQLMQQIVQDQTLSQSASMMYSFSKTLDDHLEHLESVSCMEEA